MAYTAASPNYAGPTCANPMPYQHDFLGLGGHSNLARSAAGAPTPPTGLVADSATVREQVLTVSRLLNMLSQHLFEPVICSVSEGGDYTKDNPNTLEGNLYTTTHKLGSILLDLESILSKIGGR